MSATAAHRLTPLRPQSHVTLRAKGLMLLVPLLVYALGLGALMFEERRRLVDELAQIYVPLESSVVSDAGPTRGDGAVASLVETSQSGSELRTRIDSVHAVVLVLGFIGLVLFSTLVYLFFSRLAADLVRVRCRAGEIVDGYRGPPLGLARGDELGELAAAVDAIGVRIVQREEQAEFGRRQYYYHDKMASVGTLAAGIAHEIGNPVAAIAGEAQVIADAAVSRSCARRGAPCRPHAILEQVDRIAAITRKVGEFAAPRSAAPELFDLNSLVETTCSFVRYDRRFRDVVLVESLDRRVPAIHAVPDQMAQALLNLLINAADSLEACDRHQRRVDVITELVGDGVRIAVTDNGCGMDEETVARAFDPFFTTKPAERGTGLGLSLVKSFAETIGGSVQIDSRRGAGTRVTLILPQSSPSTSS